MITDKHPAFQRADALPEPVARVFPHSVEEARVWEPQLLWRPLSSRVLVVAVPRVECAWSAYIDAVPGMNHRREFAAVAETGAKLDEAMARILFPIFDAVPYAD